MESLHNHLLKFIGIVTAVCLWKMTAETCSNIQFQSIGHHIAPYTHTHSIQSMTELLFFLCTKMFLEHSSKFVANNSHVIHRVEKVLRFSHTDSLAKTDLFICRNFFHQSAVQRFTSMHFNLNIRSLFFRNVLFFDKLRFQFHLTFVIWSGVRKRSNHTSTIPNHGVREFSIYEKKCRNASGRVYCVEK